MNKTLAVILLVVGVVVIAAGVVQHMNHFIGNVDHLSVVFGAVGLIVALAGGAGFVMGGSKTK
jgi:hypothetical protein